MDKAPPGDSGPTSSSPSLLSLLATNSTAVAEEAIRLGQADQVQSALKSRLALEVDWNAKSRQRQFEQAVLWRRWNIGLGLMAGLLTAAAGSTALFAHAPAAIIGLLATFTTGSLATLNAGQRKVQSQMAACGYQEAEVSAAELLQQLPYLPLPQVLQQADQVTARRLLLNQTAEPPSGRALYRADRFDREISRYGRPLSFSERSSLARWVRTPEEVTIHELPGTQGNGP